VSAGLEAAIAAAQRATLDLHALMAIHGIPFEELHRLLELPAGVGEARAFWMDRMVDLIRALAASEGIPDPTRLTERDQIRITHRAYDLVRAEVIWPKGQHR
jgi:hypothetical protein